MAWFNRPEGFVTKSFDHNTPVEKFSTVITTPDAIYGLGDDGWDDAVLERQAEADAAYASWVAAHEDDSWAEEASLRAQKGSE